MDDESTMENSAKICAEVCEPAILSRHSLFGDRMEVIRFRSRFGQVVWFVEILEKDWTIYQGPRAGVLVAIRKAIAKGWM